MLCLCARLMMRQSSVPPDVNNDNECNTSANSETKQIKKHIICHDENQCIAEDAKAEKTFEKNDVDDDDEPNDDIVADDDDATMSRQCDAGDQSNKIGERNRKSSETTKKEIEKKTKSENSCHHLVSSCACCCACSCFGLCIICYYYTIFRPLIYCYDSCVTSKS